MINSPSTIYGNLREEALQVLEDEPELKFLLHRTVLHSSVANFSEAIATTACYRLLLTPCESKQPNIASPVFCPHTMKKILMECMDDMVTLEKGHTMLHAVVADILAVCRRDPAMNTPLQVILFSKGFVSLVCHRAAYRLLQRRKKFTALFLQSQVSASFGVDIHPAAQLGSALMLDHGTGIVIGETATVGDGCTILHGCTLGGTGKVTGDRHPKVGNHVLIGANASLLGNVEIGDGVKIGAGSVVVRPIPCGATAVGVPAKIIGRACESKPGSDVDETLEHVNLFKKIRTIPSAIELTNVVSFSSSEKGSTGNFGASTRPEPSSSSSPDYDPACPYRDYALLAQKAPKGTLSICRFLKVLQPLELHPDKLVCCFFELDTSNAGYCEMDVLQTSGISVLQNHLGLPDAQAGELVGKLAASV